MAENKTKPTTQGVPAFLDDCADEAQRKDARALLKLMQRVTGNEPAMWGTAIVGFGSYHYKYVSGHQGDAPILGFSPRKAANVLYGAIGFKGAEEVLAELGKHTTGKGCLYIRKLADIDMKVLEKLITKAVAATKERYAN